MSSNINSAERSERGDKGDWSAILSCGTGSISTSEVNGGARRCDGHEGVNLVLDLDL